MPGAGSNARAQLGWLSLPNERASRNAGPGERSCRSARSLDGSFGHFRSASAAPHNDGEPPEGGSPNLATGEGQSPCSGLYAPPYLADALMS